MIFVKSRTTDHCVFNTVIILTNMIYNLPSLYQLPFVNLLIAYFFQKDSLTHQVSSLFRKIQSPKHIVWRIKLSSIFPLIKYCSKKRSVYFYSKYKDSKPEQYTVLSYNCQYTVAVFILCNKNWQTPHFLYTLRKFSLIICCTSLSQTPPIVNI